MLRQCEEQSDVPLQDIILEPIDLSMAVIKNVSAKWFVEMAEYIGDNPQFIVNGFAKAGICRALDGITSDEEFDDMLQGMDLDYEALTDSETCDDIQGDLHAVADTEIVTILDSDSAEEP